MEEYNKEIKLDGTSYVKFPINESLYPENGVFIDLDMEVENWSNLISSQIIGNFKSQGYGLFIEKGVPDINAFTIFDKSSGHMLYLNQEGGIISQRGLPSTFEGNQKPEKTQIGCFTVDHLGFKYIYDPANNLITKLDGNNLLVTEFSTYDSKRPNTRICCMQTNKEGVLFVMDQSEEYAPKTTESGDPIFTKIYEYDDTNNVWIEVKSLENPNDDIRHNSFVFNKDGKIITYFTTNENLMLVDSNGNTFNHFGVNLYRNKMPWFYVGSGFNVFGIDLDDNIWIVYNENHILKLDNKTGQIIFDKEFHQFEDCRPPSCPKGYVENTEMALSFTVRTINGKNEATPWIIMDASKYAIQLDSDGNVIECFNISNLIDHTSYPDIEFDKIEYAVRGDFTGFYNFKLFSEIKTVETSIMAKVAVKDEQHSLEVKTISHSTRTMESGNHRIGMIYDAPSGFFGLYIDGALVSSENIRGKIYYDPSIKPPVLIGASSGNTRSIKEELGIINAEYIKGTFRNIVITRNEPKLLTSTPPVYPITLEFDTVVPLSYKESVDMVFMLRPKGFKSSKFDLEIINSKISNKEVQEIIEEDIIEINSEVNTPNTTIREIKWKDDIILSSYPIEDFDESGESIYPEYKPHFPSDYELENATELASTTDREYYNNEVSIIFGKTDKVIMEWGIEIKTPFNRLLEPNVYKYGVFQTEKFWEVNGKIPKSFLSNIRHEDMMFGLGITPDGGKIYAMHNNEMIGDFLMDLNERDWSNHMVAFRRGVAHDYEEGESRSDVVFVVYNKSHPNVNIKKINTHIPLGTVNYMHGMIFYNKFSKWTNELTYHKVGGSNISQPDTPIFGFDVTI